MPRHRSLALAGLAALLPFAACNTDAVGISECRDIEKARCVAARSCDLGLEDDDDQATCERFARDSCLRGLSVKEAPKNSELDLCVKTIRKAGTCADAHGKDYLASDCDLGATSSVKATVCDVVEAPENTSACAFLVKEDPVQEEPEEEEKPDADADAG